MAHCTSGWYAAWCAILWVLVLFFLPETKGYTLEELDQVFSVPTGKHAGHQFKMAGWWFNVRQHTHTIAAYSYET